jgi:hypothetical protein
MFVTMKLDAILAIAQHFRKQHGPFAVAKSREIAEHHRRDQSEDADLWMNVADMVEAIRSR